jgi:hypothetical protein
MNDRVRFYSAMSFYCISKAKTGFQVHKMIERTLIYNYANKRAKYN